MIKNLLLALTCLTIAFSSCQNTNSNSATTEKKSAILLVTFGSSYESPQATFAKIDKQAKETFEGTEIRWAYTSERVLKILREGKGKGKLKGKKIHYNNPEQALRKMVADGYSKITVQSLHIIPGDEFDEIVASVDRVKKDNPKLQCAVGRPLFDSKADLRAVAEVLFKKFETQFKNQEPVLFMGHGTKHHPSHKKYSQLEQIMQEKAPNFFIGSVEKAPTIDHILPKLKALKINSNKVTITPLMSVSGDHAKNDMNGISGSTNIEEQSWKERLENQGYTVTSVMAGLGDYPEINAIWFAHLQAALKQ